MRTDSKLKNLLFAGTIMLCSSFMASVQANDAIKPGEEKIQPGDVEGDSLVYDVSYANRHEIHINVTPSGLVINPNSKIISVNLTHKDQLALSGVDGQICIEGRECDLALPSPTKLFVRKIPPIKFEDQEPSVDGTSLLYLTTSSGNVYRFRIKPDNGKSKYTLVSVTDKSNSPPKSEEITSSGAKNEQER